MMEFFYHQERILAVVADEYQKLVEKIELADSPVSHGEVRPEWNWKWKARFCPVVKGLALWTNARFDHCMALFLV